MLTNNLRDIYTLVTLDYVDRLARLNNLKIQNLYGIKQFVVENIIFIVQLFGEIYTF